MLAAVVALARSVHGLALIGLVGLVIGALAGLSMRDERRWRPGRTPRGSVIVVAAVAGGLLGNARAPIALPFLAALAGFIVVLFPTAWRRSGQRRLTG
jgi:NhaP-type Na+/H+ or K+/H+ antiporter